MKARDVMTRVATVHPDTPVRETAALLPARAISAVPVVDDNGTPVGMVSAGDLLGRDERVRKARRDRWLTLPADGADLDFDFLANLRRPERRAREVVSTPAVTVEEDTERSTCPSRIGRRPCAAAEICLRGERDLKPRGFGMAARVLDFPGGMPGDIGLFRAFLIWGGE